jgi:hypothetical protein
MRRFLIGLLLVLHGLAHAAFGMAAQDLPGRAGTALSGPPRIWLATALFLGATPGLVAAGFGVWGTIGLERCWRELVYAGAISSIALLLMFPRGMLETIVGLSLDALVVMIAMQLAPRWAGGSTPAEQSNA